MIAQEERIFDEYFLKRVNLDEAVRILAEGEWPPEFLIYERVLRTGHALGISPCIFIDRLSPSLVWAVEDLRKERPHISIGEIARLIGVGQTQVTRLLAET